MNVRVNISDRKLTLAGIFLFAAFILLFIIAAPERTRADRLYPSFYSTDGSSCADISDADYFTTEYFDPGTEVTLSCDEPIDSLYIVWENYPGAWNLTANGKEFSYDGSEYLHEYIKLPDGARGASSITLTVTGSRITIADIYVFSAGELPGYVQTWEPSYEQADILFISTHADDEVLFFGGLIPNYIDRGDVRVQVAYFSDLFQSEPYRNHEILNGLWTMGVTHYPQLGEFYDNYSESYEEAAGQYDYNRGLEYIVKTIRRFKPQAVIGQDPINGEYGHGGHMWCARLIEDAVEITADADSYPDSAKTYGTWDVPKTYFHLYPEGTIEANARRSLSSFGGKTALEVAQLAYDEHKSQQWTWFAVSDGYDEYGNPADDKYSPYSCTRYGLYRTLVGEDYSGSDVLDNIVTYDEQARLAREEEESLAALEREKEEAQRAAQSGQPEATPAESIVNDSNITAVPGGKNTTAITIFVVLAIIVAVIIVGIIILSKIRRREEERGRLEKKRQMMARQRTMAQNEQRQSGSSRRQNTYRMAEPVRQHTGASAAPAQQRSTGQKPIQVENYVSAPQRLSAPTQQRSAGQRPSTAGNDATAQRRVSRSSNGTYTGRRS